MKCLKHCHILYLKMKVNCIQPFGNGMNKEEIGDFITKSFLLGFSFVLMMTNMWI
jgi:hypothetical protein